MGKKLSKEEMRELLGAIKEALESDDSNVKEEDLKWKKEMEDPKLSGSSEEYKYVEQQHQEDNIQYDTYGDSKIISDDVSSGSNNFATVVNILWILVIVIMIGFGCWWFISSGIIDKFMGTVHHQSEKALEAAKKWVVE